MIVYIKSEEEIEGFKRAGEIAGNILKVLMESIDGGITTEYLNNLALKECKKNGVIPTFLGYRGFPGTICTSVNKTLVHGIPNKIPLKKNDVISIDMGVTTPEGYIGDTASTIEVGTDSIYDKLIVSCNDALYLGIRAARPGNRISDISKEIYKHAIHNRYSVPRGYGGHGIDKNILHSEPFIPNIPDSREDVKLRPGMVFAIEPMFIMGGPETKVAENKWDVEASGITAHFEHTILVTESDPIILTNGE